MPIGEHPPLIYPVTPKSSFYMQHLYLFIFGNRCRFFQIKLLRNRYNKNRYSCSVTLCNKGFKYHFRLKA